MNNVLQIVENAGESEFYPTPPSVAQKMLEGIDFRLIKTVLEPSAGKGDLLRVLAQHENRYGNYNNNSFDVDCIEIDANLRQILKYNFSAERQKQYDRWDDAEYKTFFADGIHIVHDDFLTYSPYKRYDLIIMNPPFSNGEKHLLKALKMQEKGGSVVCLLNAETIKNPYTYLRRELVKKLDELNAKIEFVENAFVSAERKTGVEIAIIKVFIKPVQEESDIYNHFKAAEEVADVDVNVTDIEVTDFIKAIVTRFNVEAKAGLELIRQYKAMQPYMYDSFDESDKYKKPLLRLTDTYERSYTDVSSNDYLKSVRLKYWRALLSNPKFTGKLTSALQSEYRKKVNNLANYDFSEFNIKTLSAEMNAQIKQGVENEIVAMFDRLTEEHSWYPETQKNKHYFDGWATNTAHKIGKKVIIPCHGIYDSWDYKPRVYRAREVLEDIERILNFLDGGMTADVDFWHSLENCFNQGITKNIQLKYFSATFYKKGTVHLTFTCPELIERFNIYAAQHKKWLPPCYGKKAYKTMTDAEKAVIDSFQGEKAYNDVIAKSNYYLAPVTDNNMLMLE